MANGLALTEEAILAEFDRRHANQLIFYDDEPQIQTRSIHGFQYEFAVTAAISKKPFIKDNSDEPSADSAAQRQAGYSPGSDIDVSGYELADVSKSHFVAFNKFCMYRPHLLLLTKNGYHRQYEQLDHEDIQASWQMLENLNWNYFMFFNCGKDGGCSRLHKHMQLAPFSQSRLAPWPATSDGPPCWAPYQFIFRRFDSNLDSKQITNLYGQLMAETRHILGLDATSSSHIPHNVALGRNWIIVIPRRKAGVGGAYANTLGMLGMISVASEEELRSWLDQGPEEVLSQLGVPRATNGSSNAPKTNGVH